jgi:DNA-directed RNA polymerase subunit alpha
MKAATSAWKMPEPIDVRSVLQSKSPLTYEDFQKLRRAVASDQVAATRVDIETLIREVDGTKAAAPSLVRAGVGAYLLAQHQVADRLLSGVSGDPLSSFMHGHVLVALEKFKEAEEKFVQAAKQGYDSVDCQLKRAGAVRLAGRLEEAEQLVRQTGAEGARRAEYSYQMGCILSDRGDTYGAIEYFERAVDMDPHHALGLFRLAEQNALYGNDNEAIRLYEQALSRPPYYLGALINLGLLYEDRGNYPAAAFCFRRVLSFEPDHQRARMYMKDIEATHEMYYDGDMAKNEARMEQLLSRPVTDFELSVRSRNCLSSMNIQSLGDLTRVTEADLLQGKNFGETSLVEIRELMQQHGLRIGQNLQSAKPRDAAWTGTTGTFGQLAQLDLSPQEQALLGKPVIDLNLSVRARKCMARLQITTLGELVQRTADELLATKNFGVTSLNEIRQQLTQFNLKLRND